MSDNERDSVEDEYDGDQDSEIEDGKDSAIKEKESEKDV